MNRLNLCKQHLDSICAQLNNLVGNITYKHLFTGYGLYHSKVDMFAVVQGGRLYIRAEGSLESTFLKLGGVPFTTDELNKRFALSHYYCFEDSVLKDTTLLKKLVISSIKQVREQKIDKALHKAKSIRELPNFTARHEKVLALIGITTVDEFKAVGPEEVFVRLKKQGVQVSLNYYWKLLGAFLNKNSEFLTEAEKEKGLEKLSELLAANGFRRYKIPKDA